MEILIVGVILVALMVYVSTKIKRSAAQAFEREMIETDDFSLVKPEGFISPVNEDSAHLFEAYSKDFGEDDEVLNVRQANVELSARENADFQTACDAARRSFDNVRSEKMLTDELGNQTACLLEGDENRDEASFRVFRKIAASGSQPKIYDLKISILPAYLEQYAERAREMTDSFSLKEKTAVTEATAAAS